MADTTNVHCASYNEFQVWLVRLLMVSKVSSKVRLLIILLKILNAFYILKLVLRVRSYTEGSAGPA